MEGCSFTSVLITLSFCIFLFSDSKNSIVAAAGDIIRANQIIRDGSTIVSSGGHFELGFTNVENSTNRYVGIWYKKIPVKTIVWIANREAPLNTTSGVLKLQSNGNLVILDGSDNVVWSSNSSMAVNNSMGQLLYSGNLVIRDEYESDPDNYIWQSFDILGNTLLPGAKLGWNLKTGLERYLSSWKSEDDPSPGEYTNRIDRNGFPQMLVRKGSAIYWRDGPWNGVWFTGTHTKPNPVATYDFVSSDKEWYFHYEAVNSSVVTRRVLHPLGYLQLWIWIEKIQIWQLYFTNMFDDCDRYGMCGAYGSCNINKSPLCKCFDGFHPKNKEEWDVGDWSSGCARNVQLSCVDGEGFLKYSGLKLPDTQRSWFDKYTSLDECKILCLKNCSCTAYANTDIRGSGSGCLLWFDELIDIRDQKENGQDLYIRMTASELDEAKKGRSALRFISIPILLTVTMMCVCLWVIRNKKKKHAKGIAKLYFGNDGGTGKGDEDIELPLFDFTTLATATEGFSENSMLGKGGFGRVYKGMLDEGKEIAVKRLSKDSRQGLEEFKNEVLCIAKLQHRNLVKLLGCSVQEGERLLVYEYLPNKSLDSFIFDKKQSDSLKWPTRYNIINGIARGLLYLHQDSRLRIIHRDLKASNVLLDLEMNPKISDFGTARICGETETGANTTRVVGTYGYMSPEYAIDGIFSSKSDVYSFGVLLLEIVTDKKQSDSLKWPTRYNIINGIARGLLYLHQDSRLRIIHRDLKASNVLLDLEMNPKISDFGTARICGETETGANTTRVVGTYGYMSPEYAIDGIFSSKSDVYSFGVLLLEIVTGKRNKNFTHLNHNHNLLGHAWITYKDGNVLDLVDEVIEKSSLDHQFEVFRAIQIGLLCVQQYPSDRPTMAMVIQMLTSEIPLPQPKEPGFFIERKLHEEDSSSSSCNYCSVTTIAPR